MQLSDISNMLGGKKVLQGGLASRLDLMELSNKGVTKGALLRLAKYLGFSLSQMAELLPVTERTIQRYDRKHRFNKIVSENILQLAEVATRGEEVFGSRDKLLSWMKSSSPAFGNRTPASLLGSRFGTEMVLDELGRIEHGVVS